jgi:hypothetical protein
MDSASSLSSLTHLTHLASRGGVDMRPTLLRVLTDLYVQKLTHTPDEERHYTELALRLLDAVDAPIRAAVANRLARHLTPPMQVIQRLADDLPEVAASLQSHALPKPTAVAHEASTAIEPDAHNEDVLPATVHSNPIDSEIGTETASELNELFFAANANERRLILLNLQIVAPFSVAKAAILRNAEIVRRLETAALARNREDFAGHLAQSLKVSHTQARRIASDDLGEPIITAAKALAMPRDVVYRILLFANTTVGHSVERVHALATLYDEITAQAAEHMVAIWQALQKNERAADRHRPLLWNDEARARARSATETARRAPSAHRSIERRHRDAS